MQRDEFVAQGGVKALGIFSKLGFARYEHVMGRVIAAIGPGCWAVG